MTEDNGARGRADGLARANSAAYDVIAFDFDGTIGDTFPGIASTAYTVLSEWGLPEGELAKIPQLVGPPFPQAFSMVFGMGEADALEVTERYRRLYDHLGIEAWPAFEGMGPFLDELAAAGKTLVVASSKRIGLLMQCLADEGLTEKFQAICGKESDAGHNKSQTVARALAQVGATPAEAIMVGDRHYDVEAAAALGMPCVGVLYGRTATRDELAEAGACAIAESVEGLGDILLGRAAGTRAGD